MEHSDQQFPEDGDNEATMPVPRFNEEAVRSALSVIPLAYRDARAYLTGRDGGGGESAESPRPRRRSRLLWPAAALAVALAAFAFTSVVLRLGQSSSGPVAAGATAAIADASSGSYLTPEANAARPAPTGAPERKLIQPRPTARGDAETAEIDRTAKDESGERRTRQNQDHAAARKPVVTQPLPAARQSPRTVKDMAKERAVTVGKSRESEKIQRRGSAARPRENVALTRERKTVRREAEKEVKVSHAAKRKIEDSQKADDDQGAPAQTATHSVTRVRSVFEGEQRQQQRRGEKVDRVRAIFEGSAPR